MNIYCCFDENHKILRYKLCKALDSLHHQRLDITSKFIKHREFMIYFGSLDGTRENIHNIAVSLVA